MAFYGFDQTMDQTSLIPATLEDCDCGLDYATAVAKVAAIARHLPLYLATASFLCNPSPRSRENNSFRLSRRIGDPRIAKAALRHFV